MSQINEYLVQVKCENAFTHKQNIVEMPAYATSRQSAEMHVYGHIREAYPEEFVIDIVAHETRKGELKDDNN